MGKAKVLGLLVDRSEVTGKDGGPIETVDRSDRDIAKDIAFVLAKGAKAQQSVN
jgi:phage terminase small subunit